MEVHVCMCGCGCEETVVCGGSLWRPPAAAERVQAQEELPFQGSQIKHPKGLGSIF